MKLKNVKYKRNRKVKIIQKIDICGIYEFYVIYYNVINKANNRKKISNIKKKGEKNGSRKNRKIYRKN